MKSIMGKVLDCRETYKWAHVYRPSGWRSPRKAPRYVGYHKQLPRVEMKALALKLQLQAAR